MSVDTNDGTYFLRHNTAFWQPCWGFHTSFCAEFCFGPSCCDFNGLFFVRSYPQMAPLLKGLCYLKFEISTAPSLHAWKGKCVVMVCTAFSDTTTSLSRTADLGLGIKLWKLFWSGSLCTCPAVASVALEVPLASSCGWASGEMAKTHFLGFISLHIESLSREVVDAALH